MYMSSKFPSNSSGKYTWSYTIQWHPTPVLLPGKSHGWRSLVGCSPWGRWELDTTEQLHFHFSLSCIGEGNANPLQYSCLENPRDGGACWAAVCGVAQSWTRLKRLSSSRSIQFVCHKLILHSPKGECFPISLLTNSEILLGETRMMKELEIRQRKKWFPTKVHRVNGKKHFEVSPIKERLDQGLQVQMLHMHQWPGR